MPNTGTGSATAYGWCTWTPRAAPNCRRRSVFSCLKARSSTAIAAFDRVSSSTCAINRSSRSSTARAGRSFFGFCRPPPLLGSATGCPVPVRKLLAKCGAPKLLLVACSTCGGWFPCCCCCADCHGTARTPAKAGPGSPRGWLAGACAAVIRREGATEARAPPHVDCGDNALPTAGFRGGRPAADSWASDAIQDPSSNVIRLGSPTAAK